MTDAENNPFEGMTIPPPEDLEFAAKGLEVAQKAFKQFGTQKREQARGCERVADFLRELARRQTYGV